jgi:hypothetical protein
VTARDTGDAERLWESRWSAAIDASVAKDGDCGASLDALLREGGAVPAFARQFLGMTARDTSDPERLRRNRWAHAMAQWFEGRTEPLAALLLSGEEPTADAGAFLADLVRDRVKKPRGRPTRRTAAFDRAIVAEVFTETERQRQYPTVEARRDRAITIVAARKRKGADGVDRRMSAGQVRGIVEKLAKLGITPEAWAAWGRPKWIADEEGQTRELR